MSGRSWIPYAAGIIVGVAVTFFAGPQYGYMAGMATLGVTSAITSRGQNSGNFRNAAAERLDITNATEAIPVPVTFGKVRMPGNLIRYDTDSFRAVDVKESSAAAGGKGGAGSSSQTVGYKYYLSSLQGLSMGPLDYVGKIWDGNEMKVISDAFTAFSGDTMSRVISGADMEGTITIMRGTDTQAAAAIGGASKADTHIPYRHVAHVWFEDFYIGMRPSPKTILFETVRWPRCVDDTDTPVAGLVVTGSNDDTGRNWYNANPAAIVWEMFTNKVWGRGMSSDYLDAASFIAASQFFADNDIGLALAIDQQGKLSDVVEFIRQHVNSAVVWGGDKIYFVVLMNPTDNSVPVDITAEQVVDPVMTRPAWPESVNELRLEYIDAENAWNKGIAHCQDDGCISALGGQINSQKVTLNGFTNRYTAEAQALRILQEKCYPQATINFKMNRWASRLIPGMRVRFVWDEIGANAINTFWRVIEFSDRTQDAAGIDVTLIEDLYAQAYLGDAVPFEAVPPAFQDNTFNDHDDASQGGDQNAAYDPGTMEPRAFELNILMAQGTRQFAVLTEQGAGANIFAAHYWRTGSNPFVALATSKGWSITGKLLSALPITGRLQRGTAGATFDFDLTDGGNETALLSSANKVVLDADDLANLTAGPYDLMMIGNEILLVGNVTLVSPGVYRAANFIRGYMGTPIQSHAINEDFAYIDTWDAASYAVGQGDIPDDVAVDLLTNVGTPQGGTIATEFAWTGPDADTFEGLGVTPLLPGFLSLTKTVDSWYVELRPRIHGAGGFGYLSRLADDLGNLALSMPVGYGLLVQPFISGTASGARTGINAGYVPADGYSRTGGRLNFTFAAPAGTDELRVWSVYKGKPAADFLSITP